MAIPVNDGDIISMIGSCFIDGQLDLLTTHYRASVVSGPVDFGDVTAAWIELLDPAGLNDLWAHLSNCYTTDATDIRWDIQVVWPNRYRKSTFLPRADAGTEGLPTCPPNVAHCITLRADAAGRGQRCSKHIGAVSIDWTDGGLVAGGGPTRYDLLGQSLINTYDVFGDGSTVMTPIIYHRAAPIDSPVVTHFSLMNTTRILRRRTVGLGA